MFTKVHAVTNDRFISVSKSWIDVINRHESGSVFPISSREQQHRIIQFFERIAEVKHLFGSYSKTQLLHLDLALIEFEDPDDVKNYFTQNLKTGKLHHAIFVSNADILFTLPRSIVTAFNKIPFDFKTVSMIFFFQKNIGLSKIRETYFVYSYLYQNSMFHTLYSRTDTEQFSKHMESEYKISLSPNLRKLILDQAGGRIGLVKYALRHYAKTKDETTLFTHDEILHQLAVMYDAFDSVEQNVLNKIVQKASSYTFDEQTIVDYFQKIGISNELKGGLFLTVPLLEKHILQSVLKQTTLKYVDNTLQVNGFIIDNFLKKQEKQLLVFLVANKNRLISREEIALILWGPEQKELYTEWALDQRIKRLRDKLLKFGISPNVLITKKHQGYLFVAN